MNDVTVAVHWKSSFFNLSSAEAWNYYEVMTLMPEWGYVVEKDEVGVNLWRARISKVLKA